MTSPLVYSNVSVLMAVHNRRDKTLASINALKSAYNNNSNTSRLLLKLYVFDDGSVDGTSDEVIKTWPSAQIIRGDGSYFWCRSMNIVWCEAAKTNPDYYLLLNDDTNLLPHSLDELIQTAGLPSDLTISVGLIIDPITGEKSYGGSYLTDDSKTSNPKECLLFNANCVLIPRAVYQKIGIFHHSYSHAFGDTDYSHEARRHGIRIIETDKPVGTCSRNPQKGTWRDCSLSRIKRLKILSSKKGLPYKEWWIFCRRNCGHKWLLYFFAPTLRILIGK